MKPVYFVHISDSHIGPTEAYSRHGIVSLPSSRRVVALINELPQRPAFVIHTGDVTTDPTVEAYQLARAVFADLQVPIYYVNGNHDTAALIRQFLPQGPLSWADEGTGRLTYTFEVERERFLVLDGRGPDHIDPQGRLSPVELDLLARECVAQGPPLTVFVHFPLLRPGAAWLDAHMLLQNGEAAHALLCLAGKRLRAVFHGHIHQPLQTLRDGVAYVSAPSLVAQFTSWPQDDPPGIDRALPPGFGFVHLLPEHTVVRFHTFPRPPV
jgi:Icc protein